MTMGSDTSFSNLEHLVLTVVCIGSLVVISGKYGFIHQ